jgi:ATP-dependent Clp protease ATP-binding subunit ClpA
VKGEFEQRLKNVIDAVQQSPVPVLLFIDEAHTSSARATRRAARMPPTC